MKLSKSRFKSALECPTKLFYADGRRGYADRNRNNDFLQALADGGYQVGELAKFLYHPDPVGAGITVSTLDHDESFAETTRRLKGPPNAGPGGEGQGAPSRTVIAEAALSAGDLFVRVDLLVADHAKRTLEVIEVKSKSVDIEVVESRFQKKRGGYETAWLPYLYDIAFQTLVARRALIEHGAEWGMSGWCVRPRLVLVDKAAKAQRDGLHQHFAITGDWDEHRGQWRTRVETSPGLTAAMLGPDLSLLREVKVDEVVEDLLQCRVASPHTPTDQTRDLATFVDWAARLLREGGRYFGQVSGICKGCAYRADALSTELSGVNECFAAAIGHGQLDGGRDAMDRTVPLVVDLWGGKAGSQGVANRTIDARRAFLADIQEDDIRPKSGDTAQGPGLSPFQRRMAQVCGAGGGPAMVLAEEALSQMDEWEWPLHMIDFETSAPALPMFAGMRPYEVLAFQFSHHIMTRDAQGEVSMRHNKGWISTRPGVYPNFDFVRALRDALMPDGELHGTVLRYHNHENTVLRGIRRSIDERRAEVADADQLIAFIDEITHPTANEREANGGAERAGARDMVDLHQLVERGYWSSRAGGSISLKYILPAVLGDAPAVARRYGVGTDPYQTLPPVFGPGFEDLDAMLFRLNGEDDEGGSIRQGGVAMTAWNYTQFGRLSDVERERIEAALLRYCEVDTLAMVLLVEGLQELRSRAATGADA